MLKEYSPRTGSMNFDRKSERLREMLGRLNLNIEVEDWHFKDSRELTELDHEDLYRNVFPIRHEPLIIVHGTDTMEYTAKYFAGQDTWNGLAVFTGSWLPLCVTHSDAEFNLGFAVACARLKKSGVFIAMNGKCMDARAARKNWIEQCFEEEILEGL